MENLRITLAAGETKVFVKAGRYFEIIESTGPVTIGFYDANGTQNNDATSVLSGFYLAESYSQFDIYSATAQTVEVFISDATAGSKRQPGAVSIIDSVGAGVTAAGLGPSNAIAAFTATQIVAPALNVRGLLIRTVSLYAKSGAGGGAVIRLCAAPVPPTGYIGNLLLLGQVTSDAGQFVSMDNFSLMRRVPQGWGIYMCHEITGAVAQGLSTGLCYELL